MNDGPDPSAIHPIADVASIAFLAPLARDLPNVSVGRYSYAHDSYDAMLFFRRNVLHHYDHMGDRLVIGAFCAFAEGARIVMNGANHPTDGFSTYPFNIFSGGWEIGFDPESWPRASRGGTVIGHDVWVGTDAVILPGVTVGSGAIIGTRAVVSSDVPDYAVVAGNPARTVRMRFDPETSARLLDISWWDWSAERISRNLDAIRDTDLPRLENAR